MLGPDLDSAADTPRTLREGPELATGGEAVISLALLFHELATNAVKYGALSRRMGLIKEFRITLWAERFSSLEQKAILQRTSRASRSI